MLFVVVVVRVYDDSLRASHKREQELKEKLNTTERYSKEKDQRCSKLENDLIDMQKKMAVSRDDYEQQLEILQQKREKLCTRQNFSSFCLFSSTPKVYCC